jgi:hypothetical protein
MTHSLDEKRIREIEGRVDWFKRAEERGRELMQSVPQANVYVGMCKTELAFDEFRLSNDLAIIRKVTNPPGIIAVCRAADLSKTDYLGVGRYSSVVRGELAFGLDRTGEFDFLLGVAWHTAALIKLRQHPNLMCPCFATESWDVISGINDNRVAFGMLDDVPRHVHGIKPGPVTADDMRWVDNMWDVALDLRAIDRSLRFGLAFNVAYTWNQTVDLRIGLANLWCGIEALFGDKQDKPVTRQIVEQICKWLSTLNLDEVEDAYNVRCDAVHGRRLDNKINKAIVKSNEILNNALVRCIETDSVSLPDWK